MGKICKLCYNNIIALHSPETADTGQDHAPFQPRNFVILGRARTHAEIELLMQQREHREDTERVLHVFKALVRKPVSGLKRMRPVRLTSLNQSMHDVSDADELLGQEPDGYMDPVLLEAMMASSRILETLELPHARNIQEAYAKAIRLVQERGAETFLSYTKASRDPTRGAAMQMRKMLLVQVHRAFYDTFTGFTAQNDAAEVERRTASFTKRVADMQALRHLFQAISAEDRSTLNVGKLKSISFRGVADGTAYNELPPTTRQSIEALISKSFGADRLQFFLQDVASNNLKVFWVEANQQVVCTVSALASGPQHYVIDWLGEENSGGTARATVYTAKQALGAETSIEADVNFNSLPTFVQYTNCIGWRVLSGKYDVPYVSVHEVPESALAELTIRQPEHQTDLETIDAQSRTKTGSIVSARVGTQVYQAIHVSFPQKQRKQTAYKAHMSHALCSAVDHVMSAHPNHILAHCKESQYQSDTGEAMAGLTLFFTTTTPAIQPLQTEWQQRDQKSLAAAA